MLHTISSCPQTKLEGGLQRPHTADNLAFQWPMAYVFRIHMTTMTTRHRASTSHVLANILRSRYVAGTPPVEARSPGSHSNVENAPCRRPDTGQPATPTSHIRQAILRTPPPVTRGSLDSSACRPRPDGRLHYVVISRDGRNIVTRVRVMLP